MISKNFDIKLIDFGSALFLESPTALKLAPGLGITPQYSAPEILNSKDDVSKIDYNKSEAWSIGVILIVMISGSFPFANSIEVQEKSLDEVFINPIWTLESNLEFKSLLLKLLDKNPDSRLGLMDLKPL